MLGEDGQHWGFTSCATQSPVFLMQSVWLQRVPQQSDRGRNSLACSFLTAVSLMQSLARLQTNKHKQSLTAHVVIRRSLSGLGYVLLHHRPIRSLESHKTWWCIEYHSKSPQCFWMGPFSAFNKHQLWHDSACDPVEMCWQAAVSCIGRRYQRATARIRDDIGSIHQCDGSHTSEIRFIWSVPCQELTAKWDSVSSSLPFRPFWSKCLRDLHNWPQGYTWFKGRTQEV